MAAGLAGLAGSEPASPASRPGIRRIAAAQRPAYFVATPPAERFRNSG